MVKRVETAGFPRRFFFDKGVDVRLRGWYGKGMRTGRGFTLVELMVVVVIVGILAAVAVPLYSGLKEKAISAEILASISTVNSAGKNYYSDTEQDLSGYTDVTHLKGAGFMDLLSLDGNYFQEADYGGWVFDSQGMVLSLDVLDWHVEWSDADRRYLAVKGP